MIFVVCLPTLLSEVDLQKKNVFSAFLSCVFSFARFFFERTALDECVSIDIAEKYKTTALGGHRQEIKRKENNKLARLDCDVNTGPRCKV